MVLKRGHANVNSQPNIVMILVDDLGWKDLSCYGSEFYDTPNIDALAARGIRYTDAYASAPVCSPSRASLMSGKYPARVGVTQWVGGFGVGLLKDVPYFRELPENEYSLARALRANGYATWHVGKWHLGPQRCWPERHGFDINIGGCEKGSPSNYYSPYEIPTLTEGLEGEYLTDRLTDEAVALIEASEGRPFFLNFWHYAVHTPIHEPPGGAVDKYRVKAADAGFTGEPIVTGEPITAWHRAGENVQRRVVQSNPEYAAMIENLDQSVGRLVASLEAAHQLENTIVVFTSDNGGLSTSEGSPTSNLPLSEGKGWMRDGGVRVPLIVVWPGQTAPDSLVAIPVTSTDLYPSLLGAIGAKQLPEQHVDGVDLSGQWRGDELDRGAIFWHYPHYSNQGGTPGAAVRDGRLKLIRYFEDGREELFDLESDLGEEHDLSVTRPEDLARLSAELDAWMASVGALVPERNPVTREQFLAEFLGR